MGRKTEGHEQTGLLVLPSAVLFVASVSGQPLSRTLRLCPRMDSNLCDSVSPHNSAYDAQQVLLRDPEVRQSLPEIQGHVVPGERRVDWV